jgi:hypothetical protein
MKGFHDGVQTNVKFLCYLNEFSCHAVFFPALLKIFELSASGTTPVSPLKKVTFRRLLFLVSDKTECKST